MNELYFVLHILLLIGFIFLCLRLGKSTLIACFSIQMIIANLFVTKQMDCFGLHITCTDVYAIGALLSLNLLQEYFGKESAKEAFRVGFLLSIFFIAMAYIQLIYIPSAYDVMHPVFETLLNVTPRIMVTSLVVSLCVQKVDIELFALFKNRFPLNTFVTRFGGVSLITQGLDTLLFSTIALYGIVYSLRDIILMSYLIKVLIIVCMTPFTTLTKRWVKHETIHI